VSRRTSRRTLVVAKIMLTDFHNNFTSTQDLWRTKALAWRARAYKVGLHGSDGFGCSKEAANLPNFLKFGNAENYTGTTYMCGCAKGGITNTPLNAKLLCEILQRRKRVANFTFHSISL